LKDAGFNQNQSSIAAALLIGSRAEIDPDLNRAYSRAGIVHVLAVSGMHVSLVFGSVLWILRRLLKQKSAVLIGICALWCYALLAGMSASVVRSAFMFTLLSGSKLFVNSSLSSNSLAGAALIMIGIDPNYLFDPGAQLSFAAVWGIQARYKLTNFLLFNNLILKFVSESLWICLIAQFATLPLTLSYFGTFPVYFMLANLVAVPLSTALIYMGFAALLLAPLGILSVPLFALMAFAIDWLNTFTLFVASLPYSAYDGGTLGFGSSICIALFVYIVLLPFGRFYTKFLLLTILRIIFVGLFLVNTRLVYPPQVFLSRCEKHTHIHASFGRSARSAVFGSLDESSCKRVDDMKTHAAQFGLDLVSSKFTSGHHAGLVSIFIWNNRIVQKQSVVLLPANNILIRPSISKYSWLVCESAKSKLPNLIYSRLYKRPIQRFDFTKTIKIW
jgi:competence protein ComEC